ncbi:MAG TPA: hypothetical protein VGR87_09960 [Candidatus Limnocylindria bacterium]|jgi:hypothetical protein|nr:hypothetical protein [Candidatus Limnocylindria bacterium]
MRDLLARLFRRRRPVTAGDVALRMRVLIDANRYARARERAAELRRRVDLEQEAAISPDLQFERRK